MWQKLRWLRESRVTSGISFTYTFMRIDVPNWVAVYIISYVLYEDIKKKVVLARHKNQILMKIIILVSYFFDEKILDS